MNFLKTTTRIALAALMFAPIATAELPIAVPPFPLPAHQPYTAEDGLPHEGLTQVEVDDTGTLFAQSESGDSYQFDGETWAPIAHTDTPFKAQPWYTSLAAHVGTKESVRAIAQHEGEIAIASANGLFIGDGKRWKRTHPSQGDRHWAPTDIRAVAYAPNGNLWFAAPQGVGYRNANHEWQLFTGAEGLPFNDFTAIATGPSGIWFGTTNGAIQYRDGKWHFRQGRRWLLDNHVHDIAVDKAGTAWIATAKGVSSITHDSVTLEDKSTFYEHEIERHHRRTSFGYVNPATLSEPGDKSTSTPRFSDNDGFNTGLYLAAMSFAYAVTGDEKYRQFTHDSFRALAFLSEVTQGGRFGGPKGLIARNVIPTTEPDPNETYDKDYDIKRNERDALWKIMERRVPTDKTGEWYWKCDASSDELDGHFFGAAIYFDHVCQTEEEKDAVRKVVRRIIDHIIKHDYNLVDYDGKPTRWGHFSPEDLNENPAWQSERGLNSYSILTYLSIAHHILGDKKYRKEYLRLAFDHGYGMNGMTQPRELPGPNHPGHQPDDNMAFMNYYHLIRYETDPTLLSMFQYAIRTHWKYERYERNAFTNFVYGACALGKSRTDQWRTIDLSPPLVCYEDAIDTLKRYPIDLIEWPMSNAHRIDLVPLGDHEDGAPIIGHRVDGYVFPIDERQENYWDWDPWKLTSGGDGTTLRPGFHYLLAYYMGRHHGFIAE